MLKRVVSLYRQAYSGLPAEIWMLSAALFVNRLGTMVLPFLTLYLTKSEGYSDSTAGMMVSVYGIGSVIGAYLGGRLTRPVGAIRIQVILLFVSVPLFVSLPFCKSIYALAANILLLSIASEGVRPANATAISEYSSKELRTRSYALQRMALNLGVSFGPAIGGLLIAFDFFWIFVADAATTAACAALLWYMFGLDGLRQPTSDDEVTEQQAVRSPARDPEFMIFLSLIFLSALVLFQFYTTYPLYLTEHYGLTEFQIGLIYAVNTILIVIFEMVLVEYAKKWRLMLTVAWGSCLASLGFGILPFSSAVWFCVFAMVVFTIGEMLSAPMATSWVSQRSERGDTGQYMGWNTMAYAVAFIIAPTAGGFIYEHNPHLVFYLAIVVAFVVLIGFLLLGRHLEKSEPKTESEPEMV